MPVLIFNKEEYDLLAKVCSNESSKLNIKELDEGERKITFSDQVAEILAEKIQYAYVYEGFDKSYDPNRKGKLYESLID